MISNLRKIKLHITHIAALLFSLLVVGSVGVGYLVQKNPYIKVWDASLYEAIHDGAHYHWLDWLIVPFNYNWLIPLPLNLPTYFYFMIAAALVYLVIRKRSLVGWFVACVVAGTFLVKIVSFFDWHFVFRARPFLNLPNSVDAVGRQAWQNLSSFPSGHARDTALYSTLIAAFIPNLRWPLFIFTLFVAYSRVYLGAHYPTDVIAGCLIGYLTAKITLLVAREFQVIKEPEKENQPSDKPTA